MVFDRVEGADVDNLIWCVPVTTIIFQLECWNTVLINLLEYKVIWGHIDILVVAVRSLSTVGASR